MNLVESKGSCSNMGRDPGFESIHIQENYFELVETLS